MLSTDSDPEAEATLAASLYPFSKHVANVELGPAPLAAAEVT